MARTARRVASPPGRDRLMARKALDVPGRLAPRAGTARTRPPIPTKAASFRPEQTPQEDGTRMTHGCTSDRANAERPPAPDAPASDALLGV
jgi:hypothetical protein